MVLDERWAGEARISEETRRRVAEVLRQVGYVPNPSPTPLPSLARGCNQLLGVFTFEPLFRTGGHDFYFPCLRGVEEETERTGHNLRLFTSSADEDRPRVGPAGCRPSNPPLIDITSTAGAPAMKLGRPSRVRLLAATGAVLALAVAGCSGGGSGGPASGSGPVDLTVTIWSNDPGQLEVLNGLGAAFAEADPEVDSVTFESLPFAQYDQLVATRLAGGNAPDAGWILSDNAPQYIESGALYDIGRRLRGDPGYAFDDIVEGTLQDWSDGEAIYGYPFTNSPQMIFYNTDALAAAGAPNPKELQAAGGWTWDALADIAGQVTRSGALKAGFTFGEFEYKDWTKLEPLMAAYGASPMSDDGAACTFDSPQMRQVLEYVRDLAYVSQGSPPPGTTADFFAGESAIVQTLVNRGSRLADAPFDWDMISTPAGPAGQQPVYGQSAFSVFSASSQPEQAAELVAFLTNPENSTQLARYFVPARASLLTPEGLASAFPFLNADQAAAVVEAVKSGRAPRSHRNAAQIKQTVTQGLDAAWQPDSDIAAVSSEICGAIDPLLK